MRASVRRSCAPLLAAVGVAFGISGCGSSAATPTVTGGALVTDHASAHQMFRAMSQALRQVHSVSVTARIRLSHGPATTFTVELQIPGRVQATVRSAGRVIDERYIGDKFYLRYNTAALLALTGSPAVAQAGNGRWIELSDSAVPLAASMRRMATHAMLQECDILGPTGRLTAGGPSTTDGLASVSVLDHGGLPGTARRRIILSANPPYLPLAIVQTRPARAGGPAASACFTHRGGTEMRRFVTVAGAFDRRHHITLRSYNQTIGRYDQQLNLTAPAHPLVPHRPAVGTANAVAI